MINIKFQEPSSRICYVSDLTYGQPFIHKNFPDKVFISTRAGLEYSAYQLNPLRHVVLCGSDTVTLVDLDILVKQ